MAELNQTSTQTLRLYDREGLLTPDIVDSQTGYRFYHVTQSARLDMIQYMKSYGMTLKQISRYLSEKDPEVIKSFLRNQFKVIEEKQSDLRRSKKAIERTLENYIHRETLPRNGQIFIEYIPERLIYSHCSDKNFFEQDYAGYELILRELKHHLVKKKIDLTYFCNVGTIMRKEQLLSGEFYTNEFFLFADKEYARQDLEIIPASTYCCACSEDFYAETEIARKLLEEIDNRNFSVAGDYLCEVIIDVPVFSSDRRNMFYKIQIPVNTDA
ncbi:MAG: MerR family transcriptional regulator [Spirochaetales bacterium]|nr:MerR family transcriptional regulator [Spirochaetales bacterium]